MQIPYHERTLDNGLRVVLHQDRSSPLVSVYVYYHVGSAREEAGRSGFAHLFEHIMFEGSAHVEEGEHFRRIQEAGGTLNGTTSEDRTNYFETLPSQHLELALWLESDRMGHLLPALTQEKLDNQRDVVKNERRQNYDNRPYGLVRETLAALMHPLGHPYHHLPIGSMADLDAASLEDVRAFFRRYYGAANATIAIGGDLEIEETFERVERWFGGIPAGPEVPKIRPQLSALEGPVRAWLPDRIQVPQLSFAWPTVNEGHDDEAALDVLADVLSANRASLLDRELMVDEQLASQVLIYHGCGDWAGSLHIDLRPAEGVSLDRLEERFDQLLARLPEEATPERIARLLTRRRGAVLRALDAVSARTSLLGTYACLRGNPGLLEEELERRDRVTRDDLLRVAEQYVNHRPRVTLSVVPEGGEEAAAAGSLEAAQMVIHHPPAGSHLSGESGPIEVRDPAGLDRSKRPEPGPKHAPGIPSLEREVLPGGLLLSRSEGPALPFLHLNLSFPRGRLCEAPEQRGACMLLASLLMEGTAQASGAEFQDRLDGLGATLTASITDDETSFHLEILEEHLEPTLDLLAELLNGPRLIESEFERVRQQRLVELEMRAQSARAVASDALGLILYGADTAAGSPPAGTRESVSRLKLEDLQALWKGLAARRGARVSVVGNVSTEQLMRALGPLESLPVDSPLHAQVPTPAGDIRSPARPGVHLVHIPGAAQGELRMAHRAYPLSDPRIYEGVVANYALGGSFSSRINTELREKRGITYGASSGFSGNLYHGSFLVGAAIDSPSLGIGAGEALRILKEYAPSITDDELEFTRDAQSQPIAHQYATALSRLAFVEKVARCGWPEDYPLRRLAWLEQLSLAELRRIATDAIRPEFLTLLAVGDAEQLRPQLEGLGLGPVTEIERSALGLPS